MCETTLDQSNAPVAERMKTFIRVRIAAGDSEQEIKDALVAEFGPEVLAEPPEGGFGLLAWLLPLVALVGGAIAVGLLIRAWTRRAAAAGAGCRAARPGARSSRGRRAGAIRQVT